MLFMLTYWHKTPLLVIADRHGMNLFITSCQSSTFYHCFSVSNNIFTCSSIIHDTTKLVIASQTLPVTCLPVPSLLLPPYSSL